VVFCFWVLSFGCVYYCAGVCLALLLRVGFTGGVVGGDGSRFCLILCNSLPFLLHLQ